MPCSATIGMSIRGALDKQVTGSGQADADAYRLREDPGSSESDSRVVLIPYPECQNPAVIASSNIWRVGSSRVMNRPITAFALKRTFKVLSAENQHVALYTHYDLFKFRIGECNLVHRFPYQHPSSIPSSRSRPTKSTAHHWNWQRPPGCSVRVAGRLLLSVG